MHLNDPTIAARFESRVDRSGPCHIWNGARHPKGHGLLWLPAPDRRLVYAHRLALELKLGRPLEKGEMATHECDVPYCVNPDHLTAGDQKKNMRDAVERGRVMRGEGHYLTHLNDQEVREILTLLTVPGVMQKDIARRYGVSRAAIAQIKSGRSWKHVPRPEAPYAHRAQNSHSAKLDEAKVREIWERIDAGDRLMDIAADFGVSASCISNIKARRVWSHVPRPGVR